MAQVSAVTDQNNGFQSSKGPFGFRSLTAGDDASEGAPLLNPTTEVPRLRGGNSPWRSSVVVSFTGRPLRRESFSISEKPRFRACRSGVTPSRSARFTLRAGFHQQLDNLRMLAAAIPENDRLEQGRPTQLVDMIDVDSRFDEQSDSFDMTPLRRRNKRSAAVSVRALQVGPVCEGHLQNVDIAACAGIEIRAVVDVVLGVDVGAGLDQSSGGIYLIAMSRDKERRTAASVARIDRSSLGKQILNGGDVIILRRRMQCALVHVRSEGNQWKRHNNQKDKCD